jgi:hypothetical protein
MSLESFLLSGKSCGVLFCTQGLLTPVAGEPQQQLGFCPCCMTVLEDEGDQE